MFYYLYQITNLVNGKIYVGVHKTQNLNDEYMGSGKVILRAIKKHGINNFKKKIIEQFDSEEAMFAREKEIVTEEFLARDDVYNLRRGGRGGFDCINKNLTLRVKKNKKARSSADFVLEQRWGADWRTTLARLGTIAAHTDIAKAKRKQTRRERGIVSNSSAMNTPKANQRRIEKFKEIGHQQGKKNSQFGKMWITNGTESYRVMKTDPIPAGWRKGRVIKG